MNSAGVLLAKWALLYVMSALLVTIFSTTSRKMSSYKEIIEYSSNNLTRTLYGKMIEAYMRAHHIAPQQVAQRPVSPPPRAIRRPPVDHRRITEEAQVDHELRIQRKRQELYEAKVALEDRARAKQELKDKNKVHKVTDAGNLVMKDGSVITSDAAPPPSQAPAVAPHETPAPSSAPASAPS